MEGARVFPTPVGMNRSGSKSCRNRFCVPHTRGDEPVEKAIQKRGFGVFPTPVGMNRLTAITKCARIAQHIFFLPV